MEIEGLIGFFVNTLALRLDVSGSPTVGELLERVKAQALEAQEHQDIPFEQVVEIRTAGAESVAQSGVPGDVRLAERAGEARWNFLDWTIKPLRRRHTSRRSSI